MTQYDVSDAVRNRLMNIVPQDKSSGIFRGTLGLSPDETLLVIGAPSVVAAGILNYTPYGLGDIAMKWGVAVLLLYFIAERADEEMTPYALLAREGRLRRSVARMPLSPGSAREESGVRASESHPDHGYGIAERTDGTLVAVVEGEPPNTTRYTVADWTDVAVAFSDKFDTELGKADAPAQFQTSVTPSEGADVETLDETMRDESAPGDQRRFAAATGEKMSEWAGESGVMDGTPRIAVRASPSEGASSRRGAFSGGVLSASADTEAEQRRILHERVGSAQKVLATIADDVHILDESDLEETLREAWRPHDEPLGTESMTNDDSVLWGPHGLDEERTHVVLSPDDPQQRDVVSSVRISGWPVRPTPGILGDVLSTPGIRMELSVHVGDRDHRTKLDELDTEITQIRRRITDLLNNRGASGDSGESQARDSSALEDQKVDLRNHAQDTETEIGEVSTTVTVRGPDKEAVLDARSSVISRLRRTGITATPADGDQLAAFRTTTPIAHDDLREVLASKVGAALSSAIKNGSVELGVPTHFDMPSDTIGCLAHSVHGVRQDRDGVIYGLAAATNPKVDEESAAGFLQVCREDIPAPHRYMMAKSGWGKTYLESFQSVDELTRNRGADRLLILDIAENFDGVVETLDGGKVTFGETRINPWAVGRGEGVDLVTDLIDTLLKHSEDDARPPRSKIRATVRRTYDETDGLDRPPVFSDYFDLLAEIDDSDDGIDVTVRGTDGERESWSATATALLTHLSEFRPDGEFGFMAPDLEAGEPPTGDVDLSERVILFDGSEFQDRHGAAKGMLSVLFLSLAYRASEGDDEMVLCAVDEAHDVFRDAAEAGRFESMVRAGRNRGLCFDFLSQADEDFSYDEARVIAKQAPVVIAGNVGEEADPDDIMSFGFPREEAEDICGGLEMGQSDSDSDSDYSEAVVSVEGDTYLVQFETHAVVDAMLTYSEDDGDWDDHVGRALDRRGDEEDDQEVAA